MYKIALVFSFFLFFQSICHAQSIAKTAENKVEISDNKNVKKAIIIYGSPDCHHCIDTKKFLTEHQISFVFQDIDHDKTAVQEMLSKLRAANISTKGLGIPVIDKNGEIFQNKGNFDDFLKKLIE